VYELVPGHAAIRRKICGSAGIAGYDLEHFTRSRPQPFAQMKHQLSAAQITRVPRVVKGHFELAGTGVDVLHGRLCLQTEFRNGDPPPWAEPRNGRTCGHTTDTRNQAERTKLVCWCYGRDGGCSNASTCLSLNATGKPARIIRSMSRDIALPGWRYAE